MRRTDHRSARCALLLAAVGLGVAGCATRLERPALEPADVTAERREHHRLAFSLLLQRQTRVWNVAFRLRAAGAELCGDQVRYAFGFLALDREVFPPDYRAVADELGLGHGVRVWSVSPVASPDAEPLRRGDRIVRAGGSAVPDLRSFLRALEAPTVSGRLALELIREPDHALELSIQGVRACSHRALVVRDASINAAADGRNVFLTTGMLRFVESDDELALVIGHEMAHNALDHLRQLQAQRYAGLLIDILAAVLGDVDTGGAFTELAGVVFSEQFEADADHLGLYLAARAGYDIRLAPDFWRRMAVEHPGSIRDGMLATHPSTPERAVALERSIEEIERKRAEGVPLTPEFRR
ncbi:MAG: M48 family metallopeptidase [Myxococcota bacterium]|nr:M48 family metallopeptidase [Myxococcota bacterium]